MRSLVLVFGLAITFTCLNCGEEQSKKVLLRIEDKEYGLSDFNDYLAEEYTGEIEDLEPGLLDSYLEKFAERKVLAYAAAEAGVELSDADYSPSRKESSLIALYILEEAKKRYGEEVEWLDRVDEKMRKMHRERYKEDRVEIKTLYFKTENEANSAYRTLRANPSRIQQYLDRNPEPMKQGMGQGVYTISQLYENAREKVVALMDSVAKDNRPAITDKIPIEDGSGYLLIQVVRVLPPVELDNEDLQQVLEELVYSDERELLRKTLLDELREKLDIEFNPDIAKKTFTSVEAKKGNSP